jgi:hypothetical protein
MAVIVFLTAEINSSCWRSKCKEVIQYQWKFIFRVGLEKEKEVLNHHHHYCSTYGIYILECKFSRRPDGFVRRKMQKVWLISLAYHSAISLKACSKEDLYVLQCGQLKTDPEPREGGSEGGSASVPTHTLRLARSVALDWHPAKERPSRPY